jgi:hypothetical protein
MPARPSCLAALLLTGCAAAPAPAPASAPVPVPASAPASAPATASAPVPVPVPESAPAFPAGWIRPASAPSPVAALPPSSSKSRQRLLENQFQARVPIAPVAIRFADLPLVEVEPEPDWRKAPASPPSGPQPEEVRVADKSMLVLRDPNAFGSVAVSFMSGRDGVGVYCGSSTGWRPASWQTLSALPGGDMLFLGATAWFNHQTCKAHLWQRIKTPAKPIAGGLAFAFRSRCPRCEVGKREALHVLTPSIGWGGRSVGDARFVASGAPFSHAEIALRPGGGGAISLSLSASEIETWRESGAKPERQRATLLGVDASLAAGEQEPAVVVYVADAPPS